MSDQIRHYMTLRYPIELTPDPDGGYVAEHPDLPGCIAQGETADEAVAGLEGARRLWIEARLEENLPVPEPTEENEYSGKFLLRLPRSAHAQLVRMAMKEGVSLNHYVSTILARHLGSAPSHAALKNIQMRLEETVEDLRTAATEYMTSPANTVIYSVGRTNMWSVRFTVREEPSFESRRRWGLSNESESVESLGAEMLTPPGSCDKIN